MLDQWTKRWKVAGIWVPFMLFGLSALPFGLFDRAGASPFEEQTEAPLIVFSEVEYDFGQVGGLSEVSHDFTVKNRGKTNLQIVKVKPG